MQALFIGIVITGLFVFLFGAISRARPDDRIRCWVGGWVCLCAYFAVGLWTPGAGLGNALQFWFRSDLLLLGGTFFTVSSTVLVRGRKASLRLGAAIAFSAFALIGLSTLGPRFWAVLAIAILLRQSTAIYLALRHRQLVFAPMVISMAVIVAVCSLAGIRAGHFYWVADALWMETYFTAALGFWYWGGERTLALHTTVFGLFSCAAIFPIGYFIFLLLPRMPVDDGIWNLPGYCAGVGMILLLVEEQLRHARSLGDEYRLLFDDNPHAMWVLDAETLSFIDVNHAAAVLHGYSREEFLQLTLPDILAPERAAQDFTELSPNYTANMRCSVHRRKDGGLLPMDVTTHEIEFRGRPCSFVLALDATRREALERQLQHQTEHDPLTGLANRMLFQEHLAPAVRDARQSGEKLAILCLDICRFKRINDVYGPRVGDECIRHVASVLSSRIRACDFVARIAGDEFALVLTGINNAATVEQRASELRAVLERPVVIQGYPIQLAISIGLSICPDDGDDPLALWAGAEGVLRRSQKSGGGQTTWLSRETQDDAQEQNAIEVCLRTRMEKAGFRLVYQPLYDRTGRVRSLEALLRLHHPTLDTVGPTKVIPIAEETGLIIPLGIWVIEEVCRQIRTWVDVHGMSVVPVAINVSALQLMHIDFADRLMKLVHHYSVNPNWIHLELTESAAMRNLKEVSVQMARLSRVGFSFLIDDFGTGHSSLGRMHQLPLTALKIDRSFIEQLSAPNGMSTTLSVIQAIVSMAHALNQSVVAEGVETAAELACICALECDLVQGFHLSHPLAPDCIPEIVRHRHSAFANLTRTLIGPELMESATEPASSD
ncbi:MAG: bifunctional diguanylate cyclase/phosphodiesterase [Terracidiphilus sp.]